MNARILWGLILAAIFLFGMGDIGLFVWYYKRRDLILSGRIGSAYGQLWRDLRAKG